MYLFITQIIGAGGATVSVTVSAPVWATLSAPGGVTVTLTGLARGGIHVSVGAEVCGAIGLSSSAANPDTTGQ